jgi:hypothetical protein
MVIYLWAKTGKQGQSTFFATPAASAVLRGGDRETYSDPFFSRRSAGSQHGYVSSDDRHTSPSKEIAMSEEIAKTAADHVTDTLTQLKEMRHYSKANVERLTATWLLFDGELSKLKQTEKIDDLMNRQSQLHDALETLIADLEDVLQKMQPPEEQAEKQ